MGQDEMAPVEGLPDAGGPPEGAPADGAEKVDLALQVAHVAAQVSTVLLTDKQEARVELEARLAMAQEKLEAQGAPVGLIPFLVVMRGLLRREDVSAQAAELPTSYRAVYEQLVGEVQSGDEQGSMTVREVMDEVAHNVVLVMAGGTVPQRQQMARMLLAMQQESAHRPDLAGLRDLLQAARLLLLDDDPSAVADQLRGPFRERWEDILEAVGE